MGPRIACMVLQKEFKLIVEAVSLQSWVVLKQVISVWYAAFGEEGVFLPNDLR